MKSELLQTQRLLEQVRLGDKQAFEQLLAPHHKMLRHYIESRMDQRLAKRVDPSDVIQEAMLEVALRMPEYLERQPMPFEIWLRRTAYQNLVRLYRRHCQTAARTSAREAVLSEGLSLVLLDRLVDPKQVPINQVIQQEMIQRVQQAMSGLESSDRELILLRTYDGLDNRSCAAILDLEARVCSKRYARALLKLRHPSLI